MTERMKKWINRTEKGERENNNYNKIKGKICVFTRYLKDFFVYNEKNYIFSKIST